MRLTIDLRFAPEATPAGEEGLPLYELATFATRQPPRLARILWGRRWDRVTLARDDVPPSGVQAAALVISALARTRRFEVENTSGRRRARRPLLLAGGLATFVVAVPRELLGTVRTYRRARRFLQRPPRSPQATQRPQSVAYLRAAPTLRYLGQYVGGAAAHTSGVIGGLSRAGLDVRIYAVERPDGAGGARFVEVPLRRAFHVVHWLTVTAYSNSLVRAAADENVDVVYQRYVLGSYAGLELSERLGTPFVLEFNGSEVWAHRHWGTGRLRLLDTLVSIEDENLRGASLIVVVSEVLKEQLVERGVEPGRVLVNPNGVDVDALAPLRARSAPEWRRLLVRPEAPTIGFVGTFGLWHGVEVLPALVEAVAQHRPDARWLLIGDGPLRSAVSAEIRSGGQRDRVELTGVVPHEHALELLASCDVCVSPHVHNPDGTRFFGSPTKLFEYMGLARAIVASDLEQIGDVLSNERTALLCPPGDAAAAAVAVIRLLDDPELRARLGEAALVEAAANYTWDSHVGRILDALADGQTRAASGPVDQLRVAP